LRRTGVELVLTTERFLFLLEDMTGLASGFSVG
jgi:hypothetical protein